MAKVAPDLEILQGHSEKKSGFASHFFVVARLQISRFRCVGIAMKYTPNSQRSEKPSPNTPSPTSPTVCEVLELRLERAYRLVEWLAYAEGPLEYQLLLQELKRELRPPS